jgi:septal ring factor EnvC (AmiA/AmiB activator)
LAYSDEAVLSGLAKKLDSYGKPKKIKEYLVYRNLNIPKISSSPVTLYFNVEKKSKKDNSNAVLTMLISDESDRFYTKESDPAMFNKAKEYLNSFVDPVAASSLEFSIQSQDEITQKVEKKLKKLRDEGINLEEQKKKIEMKIEQNKKDIELEEAAFLRQKELLDELMKQRKN